MPLAAMYPLRMRIWRSLTDRKRELYLNVSSRSRPLALKRAHL